MKKKKNNQKMLISIAFTEYLAIIHHFSVCAHAQLLYQNEPIVLVKVNWQLTHKYEMKFNALSERIRTHIYSKVIHLLLNNMCIEMVGKNKTKINLVQTWWKWKLVYNRKRITIIIKTKRRKSKIKMNNVPL